MHYICAMKVWLLLGFVLVTFRSMAQRVEGQVKDPDGKPVPFAAVALPGTSLGAMTDSTGRFVLSGLSPGTHTLIATAAGYIRSSKVVSVPQPGPFSIVLRPERSLDEVVVTGTMRETGKDDSPINVDVITPALLRRNATVNLFEATSMVNGVKPQINCNVCNTGDIHINGLEGPYTLILIDGMPIVSGLSSVYGLMGIPVSMIERLEIAKGPASSLYGSEAMGGTINLITRRPSLAPRVFAEYTGTSWAESNLDLGTRVKWGKSTDHLIGANAFWFDRVVDRNGDGFTDVTLQKRMSMFNKISFGDAATLALRGVGEERWGGQNAWTSHFRGSDSVYGENIITGRVEAIGRLNWSRNAHTQVSYNLHDQRSWYGRAVFNARQSTTFAQSVWMRTVRRHELLCGLAYKHLWYDDNTVITQDRRGNLPDISHTAGLFLQDEITLDSAGVHKLLGGARIDYNNVYRWIPSPRIAYKWTPGYRFTMRLNFGTGFRVVNVFTEDHAALTGAREVVFREKVRPEQSVNGSVNAVWKVKAGKGSLVVLDMTGFYYHFSNKIVADYDSDPQLVIYDNLRGFAFSRGFALNATFTSPGPLKIMAGVSYNDVMNVREDSSARLHYSRQLQAPVWSGNVVAGYEFIRIGLKTDVTANWYGPQRLPVLPFDYRPEYSPWFCLLNVQATKQLGKRFEIIAGVKNLLNFVPANPLMRPQDPFDKRAGDPVENPNGYTFDTGYNYAPLQGIRFYGGVRYALK
jgi:outer membrane receptor for ferrienterochelin and colicins